MLGKDALLKLLDLELKLGDRGELMDGWEYVRCPKTEGCDRLISSAWRVASVIESVDIDVMELCMLLLVMDDVEALDVPPFTAIGGWK